MMFENDYKNEMDNIKPDGFIKYKIKQKLEKSQTSTKTSKKAYWISAVAAVLCITVTLSLIGILGRNTPIIPANQTTLMKTVNSYDGLYAALEKFKPTFWENVEDFIGGFGAKNEMDTAIDDFADIELIMEGATATDSNSSTKPDDSAPTTSATNKDHSETTTQVEGVDEADIIKTDGNYIYILSYVENGRVIKIIDVTQKVPKQLSSITVDKKNLREMYLNGDRLVVIGADYDNSTANTTATIFDISNPKEPKQLQICSQSGEYSTSRLIGNKLYMISNHYIRIDNISKSNTESYVPSIEAKDFCDTIAPDCIYLYNECINPEYTIVTAFDIKDGKMLSTQSVLGGSYTVYASTENIITTSITSDRKTQIARFELQGNDIKLAATGYLNGSLLNQFSIDEYKDHFRFVLTDTITLKKGEIIENGETVTKKTDVTTTVNSLVIMDKDLKETGKVTDLAQGERVYSARFMGDTAYFVTFRQVDPLFSVDVSDPTNPKVLSALKIPGFSNYLFPFGEGKLLGIGQDADENTGRVDRVKLSMFNISDPTNVTESDKTIVDAYYSSALYNHKAILADYSKNLISFAGNGLQMGNTLFVYSYENGKFTLRLEESFSLNEYNIRPIYIEDIFYIVTDSEIRYFDLNSLQKLGNIYLN